MDELIKSYRVEGEKSNFLVELRKHSSNNFYVNLEQTLVGDYRKTAIKINPAQLIKIIEGLSIYAEELSHLADDYSRDILKKEDEQTIISTFLKGITIKNLSLQFRYKEEVIRDLLIKNDIVIIEGIEQNFSRKKLDNLSSIINK